MDSEILKGIMLKETDALKKLLSLLEEQYKLLLGNKIFELEGIVSKIQEVNKEIAEIEVERRKVTAGKAMSDLIRESKNIDLESSYRNIKKLVSELQLQKDTNDALIRQGLGFSTRMLNIITPDRNTQTYNAYGKLRK
ncbi:MAG: flagellar protein FlgN [Epulopiscium sp.]|jgi:flagellar biosynthesis/type III secretory pathway chaperone|nr:flagellar protein FlgN [Candidatus Epulonipiscium sp.]